MAPRTGSSKPLLRQIVPRRSLIDSTSSYSPVLVILAAASLVTANFASSTDCGAQFHSPNLGLSFRRGDTINVAYTSNLSNPTLKCFCGRTTPPIATAPIQQSRFLQPHRRGPSTIFHIKLTFFFLFLLCRNRGSLNSVQRFRAYITRIRVARSLLVRTSRRRRCVRRPQSPILSALSVPG